MRLLAFAALLLACGCGTTKKTSCIEVEEFRGNWDGARWLSSTADTTRKTDHLIHNRRVRKCADGSETVVREWTTVERW